MVWANNGWCKDMAFWPNITTNIFLFFYCCQSYWNWLIYIDNNWNRLLVALVILINFPSEATWFRSSFTLESVYLMKITRFCAVLSAQDYIKESDNLVSLHDQIRDCDTILSQMESLLSGFQVSKYFMKLVFISIGKFVKLFVYLKCGCETSITNPLLLKKKKNSLLCRVLMCCVFRSFSRAFL